MAPSINLKSLFSKQKRLAETPRRAFHTMGVGPTDPTSRSIYSLDHLLSVKPTENIPGSRGTTLFYELFPREASLFWAKTTGISQLHAKSEPVALAKVLAEGDVGVIKLHTHKRQAKTRRCTHRLDAVD